jgi:Flp pilus assembly protein protease CpaA
VYFSLIVFSIYFSYIDLKIHKIRNRTILIALICFASLTLFESGAFYPQSSLFVLLCSPLALKFKIGAGDVKLFATLSAFFLPFSLNATVQFLSAFSAIAALLMVITIIKARTLQSSIALAPAICGAFIWCAS